MLKEYDSNTATTTPKNLFLAVMLDWGTDLCRYHHRPWPPHAVDGAERCWWCCALSWPVWTSPRYGTPGSHWPLAGPYDSASIYTCNQSSQDRRPTWEKLFPVDFAKDSSGLPHPKHPQLLPCHPRPPPLSHPRHTSHTHTSTMTLLRPPSSIRPSRTTRHDVSYNTQFHWSALLSSPGDCSSCMTGSDSELWGL